MQLRAGQVTIPGRFDLAHVQAVHAHIFQDVYEGAGQVRAFPRPEFITDFAADVFDRLAGADHLRGRSAEQFVTWGGGLAGRPQRFASVPGKAMAAANAPSWSCQPATRVMEIVWPDDMGQVNSAASVASLHGDNRGLVELLSRSVVPPTAAAQSAPNAAQIAALSFPRPLGKAGPASSEPKPPSDQPSRSRPTGTVVAVAFAAVLFKVVQSPAVHTALSGIITHALNTKL